MSALFQYPEKLPNGQLLNHGDVVKCQNGPYVSINRVYEREGFLFLKIGPGAYCFENSISHLVGQGVSVEKITPVEVYKFCKKNGWNTEKELIKFKQ